MGACWLNMTMTGPLPKWMCLRECVCLVAGREIARVRAPRGALFLVLPIPPLSSPAASSPSHPPSFLPCILPRTYLDGT